MKKLIASITALLGGGMAVASVVVAAAPGLDVTMQPEGARVIARWSAVCDWRGCPDSFRVTWTRGTVEQPARTVPGRADTATIALPPFGDSVRVVVSVVALRRGQASAAKTATTWLRTPDAAPPAVDSLAIDTVALRVAALEDTFPRLAIRDSLGRRAVTVAPGAVIQWCGLAFNRYTGQWVVARLPDATPDQQMAYERACDHARSVVATQGSG
jgi:hypothetical protein